MPNLYAITGHGSKGWTLSFGSAELLADIIDGVETKVRIFEAILNHRYETTNFSLVYFQIDSTPYSPKRFHPLRTGFRKLTATLN